MHEVDLITNVVRNPNDHLAASLLADWYAQQGQAASAFMWYCKAAENHPNDHDSSNLLLAAAKQMSVGGIRRHSTLTLLLHAREKWPNNPNVYVELSKWYEACGHYHTAYDYALQGLALPQLFTNLSHVALLLFQQAVSSWWIGKEQLSRDVFVQIKDHYIQYLDPQYRDLVQNNLIKIGVNSRSHDSIPYNRSIHSCSFPGIETIDLNYSQALQDMFVLQQLKGKRDGNFLEIGSADPVYRNNTWLLESKFNWKGIAVEYNSNLADLYNQKRTSSCICEDATLLDYNDICSQIADSDGFIDYLQVDCEPAQVSLQVLSKILSSGFKFRVITFEHDHYIDVSKVVRSKSRNLLHSLGYKLEVPDICVDGTTTNSFEDWWVYQG